MRQHILCVAAALSSAACGAALEQSSVTIGGNQFWDRRAALSLASRSLGELRLGRDYAPSYVIWTRHDPFSYAGTAGSNNFVSATPNGPIRSTFGSNPNTTVRSSNAIQYLMPAVLAGVEGGVMVAAGEGGTGAGGENKVIGLRLGWAGGPATLSAARTTSENRLTSLGKFTDSGVGGSYDFGVVKLAASWRRFKQAIAQETKLLAAMTAPVGSGEIKL
jgi:predicted porin